MIKIGIFQRIFLTFAPPSATTKPFTRFAARKMVFCWASAEETAQEVQDEGGAVLENFDDILSVRTRTSWEGGEREFENDNDVSPDSSVGAPEDVEDDIEDEKVHTKDSSSPINNEYSTLFPWPFHHNEEEAPKLQRVDSIQTFRDDEISLTTSILEVDTLRLEKFEGPTSEGVEQAPFDGIEVPYDECPLPAESAESTESNESAEIYEEALPSMASAPEEPEAYIVEDSSFMLSTIHEEGSGDLSKNSRYSVVGKDTEEEEEEELSDKENTIKESPRSSERPHAGATPASIDSMVNDLEALARRLDAISDEIEQCRSMDSINSKLPQTNRKEEGKCSNECSASLLRTLSAETPAELSLEAHKNEVRQCRSAEAQQKHVGKRSKVFHPPAMPDRKAVIKKDLSVIADPSFDEIQHVRSTESVNSILKVPNSHDDVFVSESKKVRFSEVVCEACPSSHSELDFDYMRHSFDEDKASSVDSKFVAKRSKQDYNDTKDNREEFDDSIDEDLYEDDEYERPNSWYSLLVQAK